MIRYQPGTWAVCFAFQLEGSVFPKSFAWAAPCSLCTLILHIIIRIDAIKDKLPAMEVGASVMSNFTFVLGFLIVFRVQHAYSRWWEGGALLQEIRGQWFNAYSSLLAFCNEKDKEKQVQVEKFKHTLARLISLLYSCAIHQVSTADDKSYECIDIEGLSPEHVDFMQHTHDRCEVILQWIQKLIVEANAAELIKIAPPILSRVYNELGNGMVHLSNARKIAEFPIPFPLAQMITVMLLYHMFMTCTVCAFSIDSPFWAFMFCFVIIFSFHSINYIAVELENPFGDDANDLPLKDMPKDMNTSLIALLDKYAMTVPDLKFDEKHRKLFVNSIDFDHNLYNMAIGNLNILGSPPRKKLLRSVYKHRKQCPGKCGKYCFWQSKPKKQRGEDKSPNAKMLSSGPGVAEQSSAVASASASAPTPKPRAELVGLAIESAVSEAGPVESQSAAGAASPEVMQSEAASKPTAAEDASKHMVPRHTAQSSGTNAGDSQDAGMSRQREQLAVSLPVSNKHEETAALLPAPSENHGGESGQNTTLLPVLTTSAARQISPPMSASWESAAASKTGVLSAADESAGRERGQQSVPLLMLPSDSVGHWV